LFFPATSTLVLLSQPAKRSNQIAPRHTLLVRTTHWITVLVFLTLLLTGVEILLSHPRFYWGETGHSRTEPLFRIPVPSSRSTVPSGYSYVLPDQNGWSRYLHFEAAWALVITGLLYVLAGLWSHHFRRNLFPAPEDRTWRAFRMVIAKHLRFAPPDDHDLRSYNALQRITYLVVVFALFPLVIWTGLAMSPRLDAAMPFLVDILGGRQSARTLHFFASAALVLFLLVHLAMVALTGFVGRMREMIISSPAVVQERP